MDKTDSDIELWISMNDFHPLWREYYKWHEAHLFYAGLTNPTDHSELDFYLQQTHRPGYRTGKTQSRGKMNWERAIDYYKRNNDAVVLNELMREKWYYPADTIQGAACRIFRGHPPYEIPHVKALKKWRTSFTGNESGYFVSELLAFLLKRECE